MTDEKKKSDKKNEDDGLEITNVMCEIAKKYGDGSIRMLNSSLALDIPAIPTGAVGLDYALGVGGIPKGRVTEIYGPEASGKTTLALSAARECQRVGGNVAFIDAEHALTPKWVESIGVDTSKMMLSQPDSGEEALDIVEMLVRSDKMDLIIVDSVAALTPQAEIDADFGDSVMGAQARLMSQGLRKLQGIVSKAQCAVIFINQIRHKIGMVFGNPETTSGGNALKFYASVRVEVRKAKALKDGDTVFGNEVRIKIVKNKVGPPFRQTYETIYFGINGGISGFDAEESIIRLAEKKDIIKKKGSWYSYKDDKLGQGRDAAVNLLKECPNIAIDIQNELKELMSENKILRDENVNGEDDE